TCKIDTSEMDRIPAKGPYILIINHISFLEAPIFYIFMRPRRTIAMAKSELWDKKFTAFLMNLWEVLPIKRDTIDIQGMKNCVKVLEDGDFLCLAPEGTRSGTGVLGEGKAGVIMFAQKGNAPIIPMAHWGGENFISNIKKLKRTPFKIRVGDPVEISLPEGVKSDSRVRQQIADEVMVEIAKLMPEKYHGAYKGKTSVEPEYLKKLV
uniref:lysophospholipid acyltransferase family protein n=1 Tax=Oceanispirochaeta sp. TaxID=2035350 RepID=UPI0026312ECE